MDNGHIGAKDNQTFFTDGAGSNNIEANNVNPGDNLDLSSNGAAAWNTAPDRNPRSTGESVVNTMFKSINKPNDDQNSVLGKVVDTETLTAPQGETNKDTKDHQSPQDGTVINEAAGDGINFEEFRAEKDNISHRTQEATERIVRQFEKGKISPAELEDMRNKAMEAYLDNSFDRKVGE